MSQEVAKTVIVSVNLDKIDKSKAFKGKSGNYIDVVLINTPDNQYGNTYMAVQGVSKEDRDAGVKGEILGNAKVFGAGEGKANGGSSDAGAKAAPTGGNDFPF